MVYELLPRFLESHKYMFDNKIEVQLVEMEGSVEVAPQLQIADAIADLVSTESNIGSQWHTFTRNSIFKQFL